ncbi:O-antigen ligase family protein [Scytonema sp. UIC 10036]|uniref:O-antigen ligase family protein n=1 Tax=Scytonema sp. UIC 10036 TaxID=2304196 RepID=UPI0012DA3A3B|nr:O-antigen ligase [Scytonema sp. UIC 10036]MUG96871.1 O-antigen ligase family protein [Scytonema sp. UIC 10036]
MRGLSRLAEIVFVILTLFLSTSALIPLLLEDRTTGAIEDTYTPLLFAGVYLVTLLLILAQRRGFMYVMKKDIWIWLTIAIATASVLWTIAPEITIRRAILLIGTTLFGVYLSLRYTLREQLELLSWALGIVVLSSIVFAIALPTYGLMTFQDFGSHEGSWRGVLTHKNLLGRIAVLSSIVFLCVALAQPILSRGYKWFPWIGYVLSIALIILSTSKTAAIVFVVMTAVMPLYRTWRNHYTQLVPVSIFALLVVGSAAILLFDNLDFVASLVGRELTLTGRTDIWNAMLDLIWERPWFGYGLNAVWRDWDNEATAYLWRTLGWECTYGHNGFMDLWIELGLFGVFCFLVSYITIYLRAVKWLQITKTIEGLWPLMYLTFLLIYNISESTLLATNSIFWILYVSTTFSVVVEYQETLLYRSLSPLTLNEFRQVETLDDIE